MRNLDRLCEHFHWRRVVFISTAKTITCVTQISKNYGIPSWSSRHNMVPSFRFNLFSPLLLPFGIKSATVFNWDFPFRRLENINSSVRHQQSCQNHLEQSRICCAETALCKHISTIPSGSQAPLVVSAGSEAVIQLILDTAFAHGRFSGEEHSKRLSSKGLRR